ncbi:MAG: hypothetical protein Q8O24_02625 [Gallionellaceae bacterium]|nr:hypothetical protein [Gallionellaceae bacterium]
MATQFEIDCALMAGAAYFDTRADLNRFPAPQNWVSFNHQSNSSSGFEAVSFQSQCSNDIVISFAGTYDQSNPDFIADANLMAGQLSDQLLQAAEYYAQVKIANPTANIKTSGSASHLIFQGHAMSHKASGAQIWVNQL